MMKRPPFDDFVAKHLQHDENCRLASTQVFDELYIAVLALNTLFGEESGSFSASDAIVVASLITERQKQLEAEGE